MELSPCQTNASLLTELSIEQLCLAEIALLYGTADQAKMLEAVQAELRARTPPSSEWRWEAVPKGGFNIHFGAQDWRITPPYNSKWSAVPDMVN